jgi:hypothetical protein
MKRSVWMVALVGCTAGTTELPSPNPPPPWGVPISGGTLLATRDGARAVVADPDRDRVMVVDLTTTETTAELALEAGTDPGRVVEDGAGRVHVALRGAGSLLTIDGRTGAVIARRLACIEPRGLAWDSATDLVHVACTSGELVSLQAAEGDVVRSLVLDRDLRDVVVRGSQLVVTRFRTAEQITLDASGIVVSRATPPVVQRIASKDTPEGDPFGGGSGSGSGSGAPEPVDATAAVAWRTIALPDGRMAMSHQRKVTKILKTTPGGYQSECKHGLVESAITITNPDGSLFASEPYVQGALPVDIAVNETGTQLAVASAGRQTVHVLATSATSVEDDDECGDSDQSIVRILNDQLGAPTSVAYRNTGELVVFYPEYPALVVHDLAKASPGSGRTLPLPGAIGYDSGRAVFHAQTGAGIACASCHPEARDDGQVWVFDPLGARRTQSLAGGILSRGPYHWSGDMIDLATLMTNVFSQRMGGGPVTNSKIGSLGSWLDRVPAPQTMRHVDGEQLPEAIDRGMRLFMSPEVGCATCHSGPLFTNNKLADVGTGGMFKVPSLAGVAVRAPFMHDGCAATLSDRFGICGGGDAHGKTSQLSQAQLGDLIAFLASI